MRGSADSLGADLIRHLGRTGCRAALYCCCAMGVWVVVNGFMSVESCLLAALNRTRGQAMLSIAAAVLNIALSMVLVRHIGAMGVIGGTILSYLFVLVVPQT